MSDNQNDNKRDAVLQCLERLERAFRRRWENNPDFRSSLKGKDRDILIDLTDLDQWTIKVRSGDLEEIVEGGPTGKPDVRIAAATDDFLAVFSGELSPLEAYMKKKVKVKAGLRDILLVKSFMGG